MKRKAYYAVLFGATYYAAGYALSHKNCLIIDRGINVGSEFFGECDLSAAVPTSKYGKELVRIAKDNSVVDYFSMQGALAKLMSDAGVDILLETTALGAYTKPNSDVITLYDNTGNFDIHASRVIDTTTLGTLNYLANESLRNQLCKSEQPIVKYICAATKSGFIKMPVPLDMSFDRAATALADALPEGEQIAAINYRFIYDFAESYSFSGYNYTHIPSAQFSCGIDAFEAGVKA